MIKGVSKRVVEITGTESDYFEKAVLYLRPDNCGDPPDIISREAQGYLSRLVPVRRRARLPLYAKLLLAGLFALILVLTALLVYALL